MANDVLKNPKRRAGQAAKASKYIPEWVRLGKEPVVYEDNPSDAIFLSNNKRRNPMKPQQAVQPQPSHSNTNKQVTRHTASGVAQPVEPQKLIVADFGKSETKFPQQTKVSVGQNKNWFEGTSEEEEKVASEKISYDDVSVPSDSLDVEDEEDSDEAEENSGEQNGVLQPGEYGVIVKGVVVLQTTVLSEAESMIERIIFDQLPGFSQVGIDDIALIKRFPLKVGILAITE